MMLEWYDYVSIFGVLLSILLVIWLLGITLRKSKLGGLPFQKSQNIIVTDSINIDTKRRVIVMQIYGTSIAVLLGPNGDTLLANVDAPLYEAPSSSAIKKSIGQHGVLKTFKDYLGGTTTNAKSS